MKPKTSRKSKAGKVAPFDRCFTPAYALDPILMYAHEFSTVYEPAAGLGHIARVLAHHLFTVIAEDLHAPESGDYFHHAITGSVDFFSRRGVIADCLITNPPYSLKGEWIKHCYVLGIPFALLVPLETIGRADVQFQIRQHGAAFMLLNRRVNFIMPNKGTKGGGAQFPTMWYTGCGFMPGDDRPADPVTRFGIITHRDPMAIVDDQLALFT